jgi:hypothetical protein
MPRRRTIEDRERDQQAIELRRRGLTHRQIAAQLGFRSPSSAYEAIQRGLSETRREANNEVVQLEIDRLDDLRRAAWRVLAKTHLSVSQGRVVRHPETGEVITDDMPNLQAIDRLLKIAERYAKLLGLDAPVRAKVEVQDGLDAEIEQLVEQLAGSPAGGEAAPAGTAPRRTRHQAAD